MIIAEQAKTSGQQALMNRIYAHQRHIYDASRKYYLLGRDDLVKQLAPPNGGNVLEIGCGTGRNLVFAAQMHQNAHYYGIDISDEMLKSAHHLIAKKKLGPKIKLANANATNFETIELFGVNKFDRIFISYSLSIIPDWQKVLEHGLEQLTPNGSLHIVDFGQQSGLPKLLQKVLFNWLRLFHVEPRAQLHSTLKTISIENKRSLVFKKRFNDYVQYGVIGPEKPATRNSLSNTMKQRV